MWRICGECVQPRFWKRVFRTSLQFSSPNAKATCRKRRPKKKQKHLYETMNADGMASGSSCLESSVQQNELWANNSQSASRKHADAAEWWCEISHNEYLTKCSKRFPYPWRSMRASYVFIWGNFSMRLWICCVETCHSSMRGKVKSLCKARPSIGLEPITCSPMMHGYCAWRTNARRILTAPAQ